MVPVVHDLRGGVTETAGIGVKRPASQHEVLPTRFRDLVVYLDRDPLICFCHTPHLQSVQLTVRGRLRVPLLPVEGERGA